MVSGYCKKFHSFGSVEFLELPPELSFDRATTKGFLGGLGPLEGRRLRGRIEHCNFVSVGALGDQPRSCRDKSLHGKAKVQPKTIVYDALILILVIEVITN